jgi:hypothetical protein
VWVADSTRMSQSAVSRIWRAFGLKWPGPAGAHPTEALRVAPGLRGDSARTHWPRFSVARAYLHYAGPPWRFVGQSARRIGPSRRINGQPPSRMARSTRSHCPTIGESARFGLGHCPPFTSRRSR